MWNKCKTYSLKSKLSFLCNIVSTTFWCKYKQIAILTWKTMVKPLQTIKKYWCLFVFCIDFLLFSKYLWKIEKWNPILQNVKTDNRTNIQRHFPSFSLGSPSSPWVNVFNPFPPCDSLSWSQHWTTFSNFSKSARLNVTFTFERMFHKLSNNT